MVCHADTCTFFMTWKYRERSVKQGAHMVDNDWRLRTRPKAFSLSVDGLTLSFKCVRKWWCCLHMVCLKSEIDRRIGPEEQTKERTKIAKVEPYSAALLVVHCHVGSGKMRGRPEDVLCIFSVTGSYCKEFIVQDKRWLAGMYTYKNSWQGPSWRKSCT